MREVGHDFPGNRAVRLKKLGADIQKTNLLTIVQFGDDPVDLRDFAAQGIIVFLSTGKYPEEQDVGLGAMLPVRSNECLDAFRNILG